MAANENTNRRVARAAGAVMLAFVLSNLAGLARQILVAGAFGITPEMEAFNAANRVSETLFNLVAGGALASAFIPTLAGLLAQEKRQDAWRLISAIANLALLALTAACLLAAVFAPQVVRHLLAPGFALNPEKEALTIALLRLMLPSAALFGLSGLVMGVLNAHQVFFVPALTPAMYQFGLIFGVLVLRPLGIQGLAWGVLLGSALHLGLQLPSLLRLGGRYTPTLGLDQSAVHEVLRLVGPRLLGVAVVQLNFWVNTRIASQLPEEGSVSAITLAFALMLMPQAALAQSAAIAAMPTLAGQFARSQFAELRATLAASLRGVLLLAIPATVGLILVRQPLVAALYERGTFTSRATEMVAWALLWYAAGLVGHSMVEVLARAFYALHDTRTPVLVGGAAMALNVLFSYLFAEAFARLGWLPHGGLALANSLATGLEAVGLYLLMRRRLHGLDSRALLAGALPTSLAALLMGAAVWGWLGLADAWPDWAQAASAIAAGGLVFALCVLALGLPEARRLLQALLSRLRRA